MLFVDFLSDKDFTLPGSKVIFLPTGCGERIPAFTTRYIKCGILVVVEKCRKTCEDARIGSVYLTISLP